MHVYGVRARNVHAWRLYIAAAPCSSVGGHENTTCRSGVRNQYSWWVGEFGDSESKNSDGLYLKFLVFAVHPCLSRVPRDCVSALAAHVFLPHLHWSCVALNNHLTSPCPVLLHIGIVEPELLGGRGLCDH